LAAFACVLAVALMQALATAAGGSCYESSNGIEDAVALMAMVMAIAAVILQALVLLMMMMTTMMMMMTHVT
jgi:hypothetical protein